MTQRLHAALLRYRAALLEMAVGDLAGRHAGLPPQGPNDEVRDARRAALAEAATVSGDQLTSELIASGFLDAPNH